MKKRLSSIILILVFIAGLSLLLYPTVSDYWNSLRQSQAVNLYAQDVENLDDAVYEQVWNKAHEYNRKLFESGGAHQMSDTERKDYESQLKVSDSGVIGYIEIPKISCSLPIYHGTDDYILRTSIGHIEWSSLPVGGESTHCVLSGHRGLPRAKLFTDLDKLAAGDTFTIRVLDETLTYEVDQIRTVEPEDTKDLDIVEGKDYCTLVTCTPYGINTHRLLVRGVRAEDGEGAGTIRVTGDALQIEPSIVAPLLAAPMLLALLILLLVKTGKRNKKRGGSGV